MASFFKKKKQSALGKHSASQGGSDAENGSRSSSGNTSNQSSFKQQQPQGSNSFGSPNLNNNLQQLQFAQVSSPQYNASYQHSPNTKYQQGQQYSPSQPPKSKQALQQQYMQQQQQHSAGNGVSDPSYGSFNQNTYSQQYSRSPLQNYASVPNGSPTVTDQRSPQVAQNQRQHLAFLQQLLQSLLRSHPQIQRQGLPQSPLHHYQQQQQPQQPQQQQQHQHQQQPPQISQQQSPWAHSKSPQHHNGAGSPLPVQYRSNERPVEKVHASSINSKTPPQQFTPTQRNTSQNSTPSLTYPRPLTNSQSSTPVLSISKPVNDTPWKKKKLFNSPFPRYRHTASSITADNGCFFVMGGLRDDNVYGDIWLISPVGSELSPKYSYIAKPIENTDGVPAPRVCHNSILIGNAFIIYGGDTILLNEDGELDNNLYFFNINSLKWTTPSPNGLKPSGRYGHTITVVTFQNNNEQEQSSWSSYLYLFGGQLDDDKFNDMWCFDLSNFRKPSTQWRKIFDNSTGSKYQPPPLSNHTMTVYNGRIYLYGGSTVGGELSNALYCFNPVDETWNTCPYTSKYQPPAVEEHSSVLCQNYLISYGGKNSYGSTTSDFVIIDLNTFEAYTIETPEYGSPGNRSGHSMTYDMKNEKLLIMGGDQLNLENKNSSRDDVVFDGLASSDNNDELLQFTSIDPLTLDYETTYVYEFDLKRLEEFINKSPQPIEIPVVSRSTPTQQLEIVNSFNDIVRSAHPGLNMETITRKESSLTTFDSFGSLDEMEVISSTPVKIGANGSMSAGDSTAGSIQVAKKINISSHPKVKAESTNKHTSVKRVDSVNVHRNRRIKSNGDTLADAIDKSTTNGNSLELTEQTKNMEPTNRHQDAFRTPPNPTNGVFGNSNGHPYHNVGSKVELEMGSEGEDEAEAQDVTPTNHTKDSPYAGTMDSIDHSINYSVNHSKSSEFASTSPFPLPKENSIRGNIPSTVSDATMNSFLDNYTNKTGASKELLQQRSSSSLVSKTEENELPLGDETPLIVNGDRFELESFVNQSPNPSVNYLTMEKQNDAFLRPVEGLSEHKLAPRSRGTDYARNNSFNESEKLLSIPGGFPEDASTVDRSGYESKETVKNMPLPELYDRLNDLKKSLNDKMLHANQKIVGLDLVNKQKEQELEELKAQLLEKDEMIASLRGDNEKSFSDHSLKIEHLEGIVSTHQRSILENNGLVDDIKKQLDDKEAELLKLNSIHAESTAKLTQYESLLNDRLLNLNKFNRVLQKQKEYVKDQQFKHLEQEEKLLKKISELTQENENIRIEFEKYKKLHDINTSLSFNDAILKTDSNLRKVSTKGEELDEYDDDDEFNDSSINELSQGLDKLLSTFRKVSTNNGDSHETNLN